MNRNRGMEENKKGEVSQGRKEKKGTRDGNKHKRGEEVMSNHTTLTEHIGVTVRHW